MTAAAAKHPPLPTSTIPQCAPAPTHQPRPPQAGQLSHIFLVGGCDAPESSRKYYTEVVKGLPQDTMVLTLGCGKYRFYDQDLGTLANGLPRLLDMG